MSMPSILALDVSGKCTGWCFGVPGCERPISGIVSWKQDDQDHEDLVLRRAGNWLVQKLIVTQATLVAIEAPIKRSGGGYTNSRSQAFLISLQGALRYVAMAKTGHVVRLPASNTVRKVFMGRGSQFDGDVKELVQQECVRRGFIDAADAQEDRCDAIALWCAIAAEHDQSLAWTKAKSKSAQARG